MATTWVKALHKSGGIYAALGRSIDYIGDNNKTQSGELVDSYECQPFTAQSEFLLSKKLYAQQTGRSQGKSDVIAYHIRMSFKPGEVSAEKALALGRELALRWTKGKHQFIVAAHTNTNNPHIHIIYNSVNLEHSGKWQDFKRSAIALRRVSDQLCLEHGLSVIENPGLSNGFNRNEYMGVAKPPTVREQLQNIMDSVIPACNDFNSFLAALQAAGVEVKQCKQLAFKLPNAKRFVRHDTLGEGYSVEAVLEKFSAISPPRTSTPTVRTPKLLIDIETKLKQAHSPGFEHFARIYNLKETARTLIFLRDCGIGTYDELIQKIKTTDTAFGKRSDRIKTIETRQKEIAELQRHIGSYIKNKDTYAEYQRLKKVEPTAFQKLTKAEHPADIFYETNRANLTLHKAAKVYFDEHGYGKNKKLPTIQTLKTEYAKFETEKRKLYSGFKAQREETIALKMARQNVDMFLNEPRQLNKNRNNELDL